MQKQNVNALSKKIGAITSLILSIGIISGFSLVQAISNHDSVGGEFFQIDIISVFLANYWPLLLLLAIPFVFVFFKKLKTFGQTNQPNPITI